MKELVSTIAFLSLFNVVGMQELTQEMTRSMEESDITDIINLECQCENAVHKVAANELQRPENIDAIYFQQLCGLINNVIRSGGHERCKNIINWYTDMYNEAPVIRQYLNDLSDSSVSSSTESRETAEVRNNSVVRRSNNFPALHISQNYRAIIMGILSDVCYDRDGVLVPPSDELWDRANTVARGIASLLGRENFLDYDRGFENMIVEVDACRIGYGDRVNGRFRGVEPELKQFFFNLYVLDNAIAEQASGSLIDTFLEHEDESCSNAIFLSAMDFFNKYLLIFSDEPSFLEASRMSHLEERPNPPVIDPRANPPVIDPRANAPVIDPRANAPVIDPRASAPVIDPRPNSPVIDPRANAPVIDPRANTLMSNIITDFRQFPIGSGDVHHYDSFVAPHWDNFRNFVDEMMNANPRVPLLSLDLVFDDMRNNLNISGDSVGILNNAISNFSQHQQALGDVFVSLYSLASAGVVNDFRSLLAEQLMENADPSTRGAYCFEGYRNRLFICVMGVFGQYIN